MKKDAYNKSLFYWRIAMACICAMIIGKVAESWSQSHLGDYDWLLYGAVISIGVVMEVRALTHPDKESIGFFFPAFRLFKIKIWSRFAVRNKHLNTWASISFFCIAVFGVNSNLWWVETFHLIATFSGILSAILSMVYYFPKGSIERKSAIGAGITGGIGFLAGYWFQLYSIAEGEGIVAFPVAVWLRLTIKKEK